MDRVTWRSVRIVTLAVVVGSLIVAVRGVSIRQLVGILRTTHLRALLAAVPPLLGVRMAVRAARFVAVLGPTKMPFRTVVSRLILAQAANDVLPLRAGEIVKTREFVTAGHPLRAVLAAQGAEKLVELITLTLLCAPALAADFGGRTPLWALSLVVAGAASLLGWVGRRFQIGTRRLARAFAWSLAADGVEIALVAATLQSVGLTPEILTILSVLAAVNLAIALPSLPGHVGTMEAGAALGLVALGVRHDQALAFALVYRVVEWAPATLAGGIVWVCRGLSRIARDGPQPQVRLRAGATGDAAVNAPSPPDALRAR